MPRFASALVLCALTLFATAASAGPGRAPFMLVLEGSRTASSATEKLAFGFRDEGAFTALAPMCETGHAVDLEQVLTDGWLTGLRRFECGDGGTIVARTWLLGGNPSWGYEEGAWLIVAGTGAYGGLRGKGTYLRAFLDDNSGSIAELWRGLVDFDDVPPQITVAGISIVPPRRPHGAYVVRLAFTARDASGGPVSFIVTARSSALLAAKYGIAVAETSSLVLNVRPRAGERTITLEIAATDQVGNERAIVRLRTLPRAS